MATTPSKPAEVARQRAVVTAWLSSQSSVNTRAAYRCDLDAFGRWCADRGALPLTADTATLVAFQMAREAAGDSDSTIRRRWSSLSSFYDFAVDAQHASSNPTAGVDRPKIEPRAPSPTPQLSAQEVAGYRALAAALDPRLEALVALLVSDGLKVGEALALDIRDVRGQPSATSITLRRRGVIERVVLTPATANAIRRCVGKRRAGPVFISERSRASSTPQRLSRFGADHLIRQLRGSDGGPITANALRRFHMTTSAADGSSLGDVRDSAGLADVRSVRRYIAAPTPERSTS